MKNIVIVLNMFAKELQKNIFYQKAKSLTLKKDYPIFHYQK